MDYKEQIKSPQWQSRRLEILQRDDFTCQICGCKDKTLHVHHLRYVPGREIHEYEDWELITLCEQCHNEEHHMADNLNFIFTFLRNKGLTMYEIYSWINDLAIHIQSGKEDYLMRIIGNSSGIKLKENDIRDLAQRRIKTKTRHLDFAG